MAHRGQERFDFMWEVLAKGTQGLLLLFDNSRNHPQRDLIYYLSCFSKLLDNIPFVIGVTRMDIKSDPPLEAYRQWLTALKSDAPVVKIDAREKKDVLHALEILAQKIEESPHHPTKAVKVAAVPLNKDIEETQRAIASDPPRRAIKNQQGRNETPLEPSPQHTQTLKHPSSDAYQGTLFNQEVLNKVQKLSGVTGIMLSDEMGEVLHSSIDDEQIIDFSAFLASATPIIEAALAMGKINRVTLKSTQDDNLNFFLEKDQSLIIASNRRTSIPILTQQVEDVLQWG